MDGIQKFTRKMPSKSQTGDSPLGADGIAGARLEPASQLVRIEQELKKRTPQTGSNVGRWNLPNGIAILPRKIQASSASCALGAMRSDPVNTGKYMLAPGFLTGGGGSELVEPDNLTPTIGNFVWLEVEWTGKTTVVNGWDVLDAGGTLGAVTVKQGSVTPSDTIPQSGSLSGIAHIPLGGWISNGANPPSPVWVKQGCGSIQLYFCPGNGFFFGRNNEVQGA